MSQRNWKESAEYWERKGYPNLSAAADAMARLNDFSENEKAIEKMILDVSEKEEKVSFALKVLRRVKTSLQKLLGLEKRLSNDTGFRMKIVSDVDLNYEWYIELFDSARCFDLYVGGAFGLRGADFFVTSDADASQTKTRLKRFKEWLHKLPEFEEDELTFEFGKIEDVATTMWPN